jgi:hypothetical protein
VDGDGRPDLFLASDNPSSCRVVLNRAGGLEGGVSFGSTLKDCAFFIFPQRGLTDFVVDGDVVLNDALFVSVAAAVATTPPPSTVRLKFKSLT